MKKLFQSFKRIADFFVPEFKNPVTLLSWILVLFGLVFGLGAKFGRSFPEFTPNFLSSSGRGGNDINTTNGMLKACGDISEISKLQAVYKSETDPVIARWLEATKEVERSDLLPSEHAKKMASQVNLRNEVERMQKEHSKALSLIAQVCNAK